VITVTNGMVGPPKAMRLWTTPREREKQCSPQHWPYFLIRERGPVHAFAMYKLNNLRDCITDFADMKSKILEVLKVPSQSRTFPRDRGTFLVIAMMETTTQKSAIPFQEQLVRTQSETHSGPPGPGPNILISSKTWYELARSLKSHQTIKQRITHRFKSNKLMNF